MNAEGLYELLAAFAKLLKATVSFVISVRLSVRMEQLRSQRTDFYEILYLRIFGNSVEKIKVSLQSNNRKVTVSADRYTAFIISRSFLLRKINISDRFCSGNQNTFRVQ